MLAGSIVLVVCIAACSDGGRAEQSAASVTLTVTPPVTTTIASAALSTTTVLLDTGTLPPTPLFGLFDEDHTFPSSADLEAAVAALRRDYPVVAEVPVAVPTGAPSGSMVRFVGSVSWDGVPNVLTIVSLDGAGLLSVGAIPDDFDVCSEPGMDWSPRQWRDDSNGCASTPAGAAITGEWSENGVGWRFFGNPTDEAGSVQLVETLLLL